LRCFWCSNPESQSFSPEIMYDPHSCRLFGDCMLVPGKAISLVGQEIRINRILAGQPDKYRDICVSKALTVSGEDKTTTELLTEIEKDIPFYREDGGVTLSGGEPLAQNGELVTLLKELKSRNINVAVETSLHVSWENIERCLGFVDTFLVDLKHINDRKFKQFTRGEAGLVLSNLQQLTGKHNQIFIRIPVIPGFNHSEAEMKEIIDYIISLQGISEVHFLPYHTLGFEKYKMLGLKYLLDSQVRVEDDELQPYLDYAQNKGLKVKIGG
jgi:pyruvate formate lyase activating enzyme